MLSCITHQQTGGSRPIQSIVPHSATLFYSPSRFSLPSHFPSSPVVVHTFALFDRVQLKKKKGRYDYDGEQLQIIRVAFFSSSLSFSVILASSCFPSMRSLDKRASNEACKTRHGIGEKKREQESVQAKFKSSFLFFDMDG